MILTLIILAIVVPVLCGAFFVLGVLTGYPTRKRQRHAIAVLTRQLAARTERTTPPITASLSHGVPLGVLLQHRPEINALREQVVEHWREHSKPDDDLVH